MKKTLEYKGQLYDVYVCKSSEHFLKYTVYRVKNPNRKWFFRSEFCSFKSGYLWFYDLEKHNMTVEQGILYNIEEEVRERKEKVNYTKMWNEFCEK